MKTVVFIDPTCPKPYTSKSLEEGGLGGTEATVIRIAHKLSSTHNVTVVQHNRIDQVHDGLVTYTGTLPQRADHVVLLRLPVMLTRLRTAFPLAKMYLWLHDIIGKELLDTREELVTTRTTLLCVSDWHRAQVISVFNQLPAGSAAPKVIRVYNPIGDEVVRLEKMQTYSRKLLFFSSPHKGLQRTLEVFQNFSNFEELKRMKLYIANPGYYPDHAFKGIPNAYNLGPMRHSEILKHVGEAFAILHLNTVFPETFGLVYAEAQALGTPFLTHDLGAVSELASSKDQFVDARDNKAVIDRMLRWAREGRPDVSLDPQFRLSNVVEQWYTLLS